MKMTKESLLKVIGADDVISALAGTNDEVHKDDTDKMVRLWDDLNDQYAPPEVVRELARLALATMDSEPVGKPFMYGIADPDGNAHIDDFCVSEDRGLVEDTVNELNYDREEGDDLNYSVVALYRHAQPATVTEREPIAWLNDAYLARGVVDGEAGSEDAGPGYIPVYREAGPQPAPVVPVVPDFKKLARELVDNLVDCGGLDEGVKEKYLEWAEKTCRAAMLQAGNAPVNGVTAGKPLTIILPDISSKAFWSGSGKTEVFHPETYRRWVKEAIERGCIIACIDAEVK